MKNRRIAATLLLTVILSLTLAACGSKTEDPSEVINAGGWTNEYTYDVPEEQLEIFNEAVATYEDPDAEFELYAYVGSQVVNGTNYWYECFVTKDGVTTKCELYAHKELDGTVSLLELNEYAQ